MGEVFDITPAHRLVAPLRRELEEHGSVQQELGELTVEAEQYRGPPCLTRSALEGPGLADALRARPGPGCGDPLPPWLDGPSRAPRLTRGAAVVRGRRLASRVSPRGLPLGPLAGLGSGCSRAAALDPLRHQGRRS